jgi:hypothetical protein
MKDINNPQAQVNIDFFDTCFNSSTYEIPEKHKKKFSTLYHITSYDRAMSILETKQINGDHGLHANFGVFPRNDLAASHGVIMKFIFNGRHRAVIDIVGKPRVVYSKYQKDVIYHVYTVAADLGSESGFLTNYWQTIAYPGTEGLQFIGLHSFDKEDEYDEFNSFIDSKINVAGSESHFHFPFI